jgi:hypothetical protein
VLCLFKLTGYEPGKALITPHKPLFYTFIKFISNMSISTSSTRSNSSIKPLRGKENYITWSIEIENILLRNNNVAYIRNGPRAARPSTRYLDDYNRKLEQYDRDLEAYNTATAAFEAAAGQAAGGQAAAGQAAGGPEAVAQEAAGRRGRASGRAPVRPTLPKKPDEAKGEEKELKT